MRLKNIILSVALLGPANVGAQEVIIRANLKEMELSAKDLPGEIDYAGADFEAGTIDIVGSVEYFELLSSMGYAVEIVAEQPLGVDKRYLTPGAIVNFVKEMGEKYSDLAEVVEIGKTNRGLPLLAIRLSTKENLTTKPAVLIDGMHHAREIMTTEVTTDLIRFMLENYANEKTPWVADWLRRMAIWVVPQMNPDGNTIVWTSNNWWRKNARGDDSSIFGVDINRNYPYRWGQCNGSSGDRSNDTYRGASAASEPETKAIMNLAIKENIVMNLSYHSYSELVIAPFGCNNHKSPEAAVVQDIGSNLAKQLKKDNGKGIYTYGNGWEILYPTDGDSISWMHQELSAPSYVIEMNGSSQGFQPDYLKWRDRTVASQRLGWQFLLGRIVNGPRLQGRIFDAQTHQVIDGTISVAGVDLKDSKPRRSLRGIFHKVLSKGQYTLVFSAPGYKSHSQTFTFDDSTVLTQDIALEPGSGTDDEDISETF